MRFQKISIKESHGLNFDLPPINSNILYRSIDLLENAINSSISDFDIPKKILKLKLPFWLSELDGKRNFVDFWRAVSFDEIEAQSRISEIPGSRFSFCPNHLLHKIARARCNFSAQAIFYSGNSGLVSLSENHSYFNDQRIGETKTLGISRWKLEKTLKLAIIGDIESNQFGNCEKSREIQNDFLNCPMDDVTKRAWAIWLKYLAYHYNSESEKAYFITSGISNCLYRSHEIDGIQYPSKQFQKVSRLDSNENFAPGWNYAILPTALDKRKPLKLVRRSMAEFKKIGENELVGDVKSRFLETEDPEFGTVQVSW